MTLDLYLAFVIYALTTTILPGPNNVLLLSEASRHGFKKCLLLLLGIWTGLITLMILAGTFCTILSIWVPKIVPVFKYIGAAYILYLAWRTFTRKGASSEDEQTKEKPLPFWNGFLLQFLNVKVIMLGLAAFPGYFLNGTSADNNNFYIGASLGANILLTLLFAFTMTICCGTGNIIWASLGSILRPIYNKYYRIVNTIMAFLLIYCAVKILLV